MQKRVCRKIHFSTITSSEGVTTYWEGLGFLTTVSIFFPSLFYWWNFARALIALHRALKRPVSWLKTEILNLFSSKSKYVSHFRLQQAAKSDGMSNSQKIENTTYPIGFMHPYQTQILNFATTTIMEACIRSHNKTHFFIPYFF